MVIFNIDVEINPFLFMYGIQYQLKALTIIYIVVRVGIRRRVKCPDDALFPKRLHIIQPL